MFKLSYRRVFSYQYLLFKQLELKQQDSTPPFSADVSKPINLTITKNYPYSYEDVRRNRENVIDIHKLSVTETGLVTFSFTVEMEFDSVNLHVGLDLV